MVEGTKKDVKTGDKIIEVIGSYMSFGNKVLLHIQGSGKIAYACQWACWLRNQRNRENL